MRDIENTKWKRPSNFNNITKISKIIHFKYFLEIKY